jgi:LuxR family transcriptional regulator, maltose regulon positive regulatory protein
VTREAPSRHAGTLPATKFALPPEQPAVIVRGRLMDALDAGIRRPLTLISAPPGAGKTALLGSWIAAGGPPGPVAWLSLDAADADRRRFWRAVLEALTRAGAGDSIGELAVHPRVRPDVLVSELTAALAERQDTVVLVLDDFHEVAEAVHADIDLLLHHPLPALKLVIATRADPPLRLSRLRLQDQLTELREPDLAMTFDETAQMLASAGVSMDEGHVRRLWEHTEGWAGALRLAALSLREHPDPGAFVDDFAGDDRAISDYLISEVMSLMSPDERDFLLRTSIVGVLSGDLADTLTGRADGHRHLAELARGGVLLAPLDRRGEWYRYHALFRELLQAELRSDDAALLPELHRRAAVWLADNGDDARGLMHAVEAEAWDLAARLAGERWVDLLLSGEVGALGPLVERLPSEWTVEDPEVALAVASALLDRGDHAEAAKLLALAEAAADRVPAERRRRFAVSFSALQLHVARLRGDLEAAVDTGRELARRGDLESGAIDSDLRALALVNLGIAELWTGALDGAEHHLERARGAAADAGHDWVVLIAISHLAMLSGTRQDYPRAARHAREAIALAERRGWQRTWPAGAAYLVLGTAQFIWDRGDDAADAVELAREALAGTQERPLRATLALLRSGVLGDRGETEAALAVIEAGAEELGDFPLVATIRDHFAIREAMLRAQLGDREQAARLVGGGTRTGPGTLRNAVVVAQLQLADGDTEIARETLAPWSGQHEETVEGVQARVVEALAHDAASDQAGAAESLEQALELAEPGGLRWALLQFGRPLQPLLTRQLRRGTSHRALVGELLAALDGSNGRDRAKAPLVLEPLSPREQAVLRYLPTMMSNQEIASELFVSVNTVKTHLKAIYRKLDVADRREAVRRARRLEMLAP